MAITPGLTEATAKTFFSTLKEVGTDKAVSEALIGGAVGVGGNLAYNTVSGDSGGYTGAALLGGAVGGWCSRQAFGLIGRQAGVQGVRDLVRNLALDTEDVVGTENQNASELLNQGELFENESFEDTDAPEQFEEQ